MQHLIINLEAPLLAFGGAAIDNLGVIRRFPAASMLTGLLANALGWRRIERTRHQELQDRLVFAVRIDREPAGGRPLTDFQTAAINNTEQSWTTRGRPEGRSGGTYRNHLRYRDYFADMQLTVALRLEPADRAPTLAELANALQEPARPLFIGRKPCLPAVFLFGGFSEGDTALAALLAVPTESDSEFPDDPNGNGRISLAWSEREANPATDNNGLRVDRTTLVADQRNWISGLHGGGRMVCEGSAARDQPTPEQG